MSNLKLGDMAILIRDYDSARAGEICTIIKLPDVGEDCYGVLFDEERYHSGVLGMFPNREYWVAKRCLRKIEGENKELKRTVKCKKCGKIIPYIVAKKSQNGDYYCNKCSHIESYYTKNNERVHTLSKNRKTYGFELECVKKTDEEYLNMLHEKYHLIPTYDGSLPENGVEFKTPTYLSLRGVESVFNQFYKWVNFSHNKCGQHINIGDTEYINDATISWIKYFADEIFDELRDYMSMHRDSTERICGRYFTAYASNTVCYSDHCSWINLSHDNRIEFRLSKFVNPKQYITLTKMWTEMLDCVINNFVKKYIYYDNSCDYNYHIASVTSDKLVKIFQKYETLTKK